MSEMKHYIKVVLIKIINVKEKLILAFICLCLINSVKAQKTIEQNKQWNVVDYKVFTPNICTDLYSFRNDTIINSIEYLELFVKRDTSNSSNWEPLDILMREDSTNRIYILENGVDKIIYDFNLMQNDTFQLNVNFSDCELIVHQVDTIQLLNGDSRKRIRLIRSDDPDPNQPWYGYKDWIQGIGSTTSLHRYIESCFTDYPLDLLCYYVNEEIIYSNVNSQGCFLTPVEEVVEPDLFTVFPNPARNEIQISSSEEIDFIKVLDLNGRIVVTSKQQTINLSHMKSGIYIIQITSPKGIIAQKVILD